MNKIKKRDILVYAPISMGSVDGSSIWLKSVIEVLSSIQENSIDVLLYDNPRGDYLNVADMATIWPPSHYFFTNSPFDDLKVGDRIRPNQAVNAIRLLKEIKRYDYILTRGMESADHFLSICDDKTRLLVYLSEVHEEWLWNREKHQDGIAKLRRIVNGATVVYCQTMHLANVVEELCADCSYKIDILPPMLPNELFEVGEQKRLRAKEAEGSSLKMIYAGKFANLWGIDELFAVNDKIAEHKDNFELHVYGNKIHGSDKEFYQRTKKRLDASRNFVWNGAVDRDVLLKSLSKYDLGYAYRSKELDSSTEISTKLLEYIACGVAPILNKTAAHVDYLGEDYPLFVSSEDELFDILMKVLSGEIDIKSYEINIDYINKHKFSSVRNMFINSLKSIEHIPAEIKKNNLLIVSHDFKFMGDLFKHIFHRDNFNVELLQWQSFKQGDAEATLKALHKADVVFCEWATANAVFCSENMRPGQRLFIRLHRFEITTDFPSMIKIENVEKIIVVSEHMAQIVKQTYGWPDDKVLVIPNTVDTIKLNREKTNDSMYNLGIMGILPKLKRFDLAVELLSLLKERNARYKLHVKGKLPWELPWLWMGADNKNYYLKQFDRFKCDPRLGSSVIFDPHDMNIPRWFQKIGWVLSLSDVESFHLAAFEGMASGATPIVINRQGVADLFPQEYIFNDLHEMAHFIDDVNSREHSHHISDNIDFVKKYEKMEVMLFWKKLLEND